MNHYEPHPGSAFEGYYSKFRLPSGAHLALIICSVFNAKSRPYMVSITYVSKDSTRHWQREYWPESISYDVTGPNSFEMRVPGYGKVICTEESVKYDFSTDDFQIKAETKSGTRQPWLQNDPKSTPAGILVHLPLPIQWHVHSLSTSIQFTLNLSSSADELRLHKDDASGTCTVHQEKNWASSFPDKYIWIQAWDTSRARGLCVAGGEALPGIEAYLLTYTSRNKDFESVTFTPPWTFSIFGVSPFCQTLHDYANRRISLDVSSLFRRLQIESVAPKETFFSLSAPLPEGHRSNFACESFAAIHHVKLWKRDWPWQAWKLVHEDRFEHGSLEYGGGYYDDAGEKKE